MKIKKIVRLVIQNILIVCVCNIFSFCLTRTVLGSTESFAYILEDIKYLFTMDYMDTYKFHFSNITVFFILLTCQYIRQYRTSLYNCAIVLVILSGIYIGIIDSVYGVLKFKYDFYVDKLTIHDLIITVSIILFSQLSNIYFYKGKEDVNKKYIRSVYQFEHPIYCVLIIHLYFSQYSYLIIYDEMDLFVICTVLFSMLIIYFLYNLYLLKRMNIYLNKIKNIDKEILVYVYSIDRDINNIAFKYFMKPCITKRGYGISYVHTKLNGVVLSREQYEYCKNNIKENICIGIDCYSSLFSGNDELLHLDEFSFSVAIIENQPFKEEESDYITVLKNKYSDILMLEKLSHLNHSVYTDNFFYKIQNDSVYIHEIKKARKELANKESITNIKQFDKYLISVLNKLEYELDRYVAFNNILKGYEAIIHYVCAYYLIDLDIKLDDEWESLKIINQVERGGLGTWLETVYRVLKINDSYKRSWLSDEISKDIYELFKKISYPSSIKVKGNNVRENESYYHFLSNRIVNLRNCTIGHGSSIYIPSDEELIYLYKIYIFLLQEIYINFKPMLQDQETVWIIQMGKNVAFLDTITPELNELRYLDYLSENSIPLIWKKTGR